MVLHFIAKNKKIKQNRLRRVIAFDDLALKTYNQTGF